MTVGISRKLEQRSVSREYFPGDFRPSLEEFAKYAKRIPKVQGFELIDAAGMQQQDERGTFFKYVALFQQDGTTLEAIASRAEEKLLEREAAVENVVLTEDRPLAPPEK